jgi:hypothetical protein
MKTSNAKSPFEGTSFRFKDAQGVLWESMIEQGTPRLYEMVEYEGDYYRRHECEMVYRCGRWDDSRSVLVPDSVLEELLEAEEVVECSEESEYWSRGSVVWSDVEDQWIPRPRAVCVQSEWVHMDSDCYGEDVHGEYFFHGSDDWVYVETDGEYYPRDEVHYCSETAEYRVGDDEECEYCNPTSEQICRYHKSRKPNLYRGISPFLVGFEVEKTEVNGSSDQGDFVEETPLFAGWETDASCGVEGITHAYDPLDAQRVNQFRQDLLDSLEYVNEPTDGSCGGHINVSSTEHTPRTLLERFRIYAPLWYSVYRKRLGNEYCGQYDKKCEHGQDKYSPVRTRSFGIEIRLPRRVTCDEVLLRRFQWMGITCQAMLDCRSFNSYVRECRDLLLNGAYRGNRAKYANILRHARRFRRWMLDGIIHPSIAELV